MKAIIADKIVVIGLGMTGVSVVKHLVKQVPEKAIYVIDTRLNPPGEEALPSGVTLHKGELKKAWLLDADLIVLSPGICLNHPVIKEAIDKGIEIIGDIELFARAVTAPVIGITGSNGKSTVTSLLGEMAKADGIKVGVGGNIGVPALDLLEEDCALYVLELSSFQLETTFSLAMKGAAFLNFSEDHMDRYDSLESYLIAKQRIFTHASCAIWNQDDLNTYPLIHKSGHKQDSKLCSFGFEKGDYHLGDYQGGSYFFARDIPLLQVAEMGLFGRHNSANCLAAMALADVAGISKEAQIQAIREYHGLAHRCQKVLSCHDIVWVNDSKATNLASTLAALNGLKLDGHLHLLVGGDSKGAELIDLKEALSERAVSLYCFGRDKAKFMPLHSSALMFDTLEQAMMAAYQKAKAKDVILLSPAAASLDQFSHFMARGDAFVAYANHLCNLPKEYQPLC